MPLITFLTRDAHTVAYAVARCPSGWLDVTFVYRVETAKRIFKLFHLLVAPPL